ncbi:MAG: hypothetical protein ACK4NC_05225 [Candidatus Gracilibacteria bacterium]
MSEVFSKVMTAIAVKVNEVTNSVNVESNLQLFVEYINNFRLCTDESDVLKREIPGLVEIYLKEEVHVPIIDFPEHHRDYKMNLDESFWSLPEKQRLVKHNDLLSGETRGSHLEGQFGVSISPGLIAVFSSDEIKAEDNTFPQGDLESIENRQAFIRFLFLHALKSRIIGHLSCLYPGQKMISTILKGTLKLRAVFSLYVLLHSKYIYEYKGFEGQRRLVKDVDAEHLGHLFTISSLFGKTTVLGWKSVNSASNHVTKIEELIKNSNLEYKGFEGYLRLAKECGNLNLKIVYQVVSSMDKVKELGWQKIELPYKVAASARAKLLLPDLKEYIGFDGLIRLATEVNTEYIIELAKVANCLGVNTELGWKQIHLTRTIAESIAKEIRKNPSQFRGEEGLRTLQKIFNVKQPTYILPLGTMLDEDLGWSGLYSIR